MIIRTISQLPLAENITDNDLIEISQSVAEGGYKSSKLSVSQLEDKFSSDISSVVGTNFNMYSGNGKTPIDVLSYANSVDALKDGDMTVAGAKTFSTIPKIMSTLKYSSDPEQVANVKEVKQLIDDRALFIGADYMVDADPGTDSSPANTIARDEFMYWHIDGGTKDSTQWKNPDYGNAKTDIDGILCEHSGYLNIFGWLADNGNTKPADAWVGLFAQLQVRDSESQNSSLESKWILLQLHPWVLGQKCSDLQYVSFNVPVKAGLRLKIKTGFAVNGNSSTAAGQGIQFALNQPNSFVGYIIRAQD